MGKLAQIKTKATGSSVEDFIAAVPDAQKRKDSFALVALIEKVTKEKAKMWGTSIIGFVDFRYKSERTGREVDWFKIGFSPRKANLTLYLGGGLQQQAALLKKLGKHKTGGGCLYINKLEDVDINVLKAMLELALKTR